MNYIRQCPAFEPFLIFFSEKGKIFCLSRYFYHHQERERAGVNVKSCPSVKNHPITHISFYANVRACGWWKNYFINSITHWGCLREWNIFHQQARITLTHKKFKYSWKIGLKVGSSKTIQKINFSPKYYKNSTRVCSFLSIDFWLL